jgi:hypothetical protein
VTVFAGNTPPVAVIDAPGSNLTWKVDDQIAFSGHATDAQEGDLPPSALSWSLVLQHCPAACHAHPIQTMEGIADGSFAAPDHGYPAHLELSLTATDSQGSRNTTTVRLDPQTVTVELRSDPPGLVLALGSIAQPAPFTRTAIRGSTLSVSAPSPQALAGKYYRFVGWSDGGTETHLVVVPNSTILAATYQEVQGDPPPTANAGSDKSVGSGAGFVLDGGGSADPQGQPLGYHWEQVGGPAAVLRDEDEARATVDGVTGPATLTFRLTVTDTAGQTDTDEVTITVAQPK